MNTNLGHKPDLCGRCKRVKKVKASYMDDPENGYGVQGKCDRCEGWFFDLWSMIEIDVLDRLAEV